MTLEKIKLSEAKDPKKALSDLVQRMILLHKEKAQDFPDHAAIVGSDTETMWNALLFYMDGGVAKWVHEGIVVSDNEFVPTLSYFNELRELLIDVDISKDDITALPKDHPFLILGIIDQLAQLKTKENKTEQDLMEIKTLEQALNVNLTPFLKNLLEEIQKQDKDLDIVVGRYQSRSQDGVLISTDTGTADGTASSPIMLNVRHLVRKDKGKLMVEPLDSPAIPENRGEAYEQHETMMRAEKYHQLLLDSLRDFVHKPNQAADDLFARTQGKRPAIPDEKRPKVSIIGLGPAGIFAAIRAYQQGAIVTAIEKREGYSRNNTFRLTPEVVDELIHLFVEKPEDVEKLPKDHPLRKVIDIRILSEKKPSPLGEFYAISIKDFEYLADAWVELMAKKDPKGMRAFRGHYYVPQCMEKEKKTIYIRETAKVIPKGKEGEIIPGDVKIATDILIAADGYNSQCRADCGINVEKMSSSAPYATFTYHPKRGTEEAFFQSLLTGKPRAPVDMAKLKALGWEYNRQPVPRYFNTGDHPYLGIEIPEKIAKDHQTLSEQIRAAQAAQRSDEVMRLKIQRDKLLDDWGRLTLSMFVPENEIQGLVLKESAVINVQLQKAQKVTNRTTTEMDVAIIGDAAQSAHFQTGRGAIIAIEEANDVGKAISDIMRGVSPSAVWSEFETKSSRKTLGLHELAFHFPTKEDLRVKQTAAFARFREDTRVGMIKEDPTRFKPETSKEATVKARTTFMKQNR